MVSQLIDNRQLQLVLFWLENDAAWLSQLIDNRQPQLILFWLENDAAWLNSNFSNWNCGTGSVLDYWNCEFLLQVSFLCNSTFATAIDIIDHNGETSDAEMMVDTKQGLAFHGYDESHDSSNQGNFLKLLQFLANHNEDYNVVAFKNALDNLKLTSPEIQKDIVSVASNETVSAIIRDLGDSLFAIMIDESRDIFRKKQMAIILCYVNNNRLVVERFLGVEHVTISFVALAKNHDDVNDLFNVVAIVVNIVGASSKCCDLLRDKQACKVIETLSNGELSSGKCLNQETNLQRANDKHWGLHYGMLMSIILMFSSIIDVLEIVAKDGSNSEQRFHAKNIFKLMQSFYFVFSLFFMKDILGFTNELSQVLQREDQVIVNAMNLVEACKQALQLMRDNGWETLLSKVYSFCADHDIDVPNMDDKFFIQGRSQRKAQAITNVHYYCIKLFYNVLDMQLQELNNRFNKKLIRLAELYPDEFSNLELMALDSQLHVYILDIHSNVKFMGLKGIGDLTKMMVETKKDRVFPLVYLLMKLALILPVVTASIERCDEVSKMGKTSTPIEFQV
ncbi:uncharacterized protein LOC116124787 [Pistacia vera]|uniref:uncharacterized protein LOC116124787 n=1 Tax=Pistacia vera TaxID=55513 RepID=UPI00126320CD|nr:uncharacterized protein LOC116124787 [Pistacia vera]